MGSGRIKGITIEIGGDTTGLDKALKGLDGQIGDTQKSLRDVNKLLKFDPKNTELLAQKQRLLKDAIGNTQERLKVLKETDDKVKDNVKNYDAWAKAYKPIQNNIDETKDKIKALKAQMAEMEKLGNIDTTEYQNLQTTLDETKNDLKKLKKQAKETSDEFGNPISVDQYDKLQREIVETKNQLKDLQSQVKTTSQKVSQSFSSFGKSAKAAGDALSPASTAATGLLTAAMATVPATAELREDLAKLDNNAREAGVGIDKTREAFETFNVISGEVDSSVEATSNLLQAGYTDSNLQRAIENLSGAYLKFPDTLKIESLADSLQETLATGKATGQYAELLERLGINTESFEENLNSLGSETARQNYALKVLEEEGLSDTYNAYIKNNEAMIESKQANYELQESLAGLAETIQPILTKITELATKLITWFNELSPTAKIVIGIIVTLVAILAPLLTFIGSIAIGISALIPIVSGLNISILPIIVTIAAVVAAITLVIAIIKNWGSIVEWVQVKFNLFVSKIKIKAKEIGDNIKSGFDSAIEFIKSLPKKALEWGKDFIQGLIDGIKEKVSGVVDAVKGIGEKIAEYIHFSRPDKGPLHYYEEWMPDFMNGLAKGIYDNIPLLESAAQAVANTLSSNAIKDPVSNGIDPDLIYGAVRNGAQDGSPRYVMIDERSFKRSLIGMGVVTT